MDTGILLFPGGIGIFLLGVLILTDGLRALAGNSLRSLLVRFTKTPTRGAAAGALATAVIQSSSATAMITVGLVGAGILTFPQGLGIVFGANIGTTITGWLVAIVGFKLHLGEVVLPLILAGVLVRLFAASRWRHVGWTAAGFGLLFVGIDLMQAGLAPFEGAVTPADFPGDTLFGRLQLVLIGAAITLITQSSSAGVAAALVALSAGTISFGQAAAMVIGMDVGTTFKAALATVGGATASRQTGYAHVIYNLMTAVLALILLGPFAAAVDPWIAGGGAGNAQIALVAFHTCFNTLGVIAVLPFAGAFARFVTRLVPERGPPLLRRLDERLLRDPSAAVDAAVATIRDIAVALIGILAGLLDVRAPRPFDPTRLAAINGALEATRGFVEQIRTEPVNRQAHRRHLATVHALDHLSRLSARCAQESRISELPTEPRLRRLANIMHGAVTESLRDEDPGHAESRWDRLRSLLRRQRHLYRERTVEAAAAQRITTFTTLRRLDSVRWLHRVAYHVWRILHHLRVAAEAEPKEASREAVAGEPDLDLEED